MAEDFLYLSTRGRKTGHIRRIEIWFVERAGRYYMVSEMRERSHWVQNIQVEPQVSFSVGTRARQTATLPATGAIGRIVSPTDEPVIWREVCALMDAKYGWSDGLVVELTPLER